MFSLKKKKKKDYRYPFFDDYVIIVESVEYCSSSRLGNVHHYENAPIQIYRKFHLQKLKSFG